MYEDDMFCSIIYINYTYPHLLFYVEAFSLRFYKGVNLTVRETCSLFSMNSTLCFYLITTAINLEEQDD